MYDKMKMMPCRVMPTVAGTSIYGMAPDVAYDAGCRHGNPARTYEENRRLSGPSPVEPIQGAARSSYSGMTMISTLTFSTPFTVTSRCWGC